MRNGLDGKLVEEKDGKLVEEKARRSQEGWASQGGNWCEDPLIGNNGVEDKHKFNSYARKERGSQFRLSKINHYLHTTLSATTQWKLMLQVRDITARNSL